MEEKIYCSKCGELIEDDDYAVIGEDFVCSDCVDNYCTTCDRCDTTIWDSDTYGDDYTTLCQYCYDNYYSHCDGCDNLMHNDDLYEYDGDYYCSECYHERKENNYIHEYGYKPDPVFFGEDSYRYFGVELEIDIGGRDSDNAKCILDRANIEDDFIYIKSDGSLSDGMEIVSHPMTLDYHANEMNWEAVLKESLRLGYRSHQTSTCGLHIHVNRI